MEILNCQTQCDFILKNPVKIATAIDNEKNNKINLLPGLIQKFIYQDDGEDNTDLKKSLASLGYLRKFHEIMSGLFLSNSLIRCFQQNKLKPRIETA
jgi:hypothetical protein